MILDKLFNHRKYDCVNSGFKKAFEYLETTDFSSTDPGEYEIDGRDVYAIVAHSDGSSNKKARLEIHRKYIDIQYTHKGSFNVGYRSLESCKEEETKYDAIKDIQFFKDDYESLSILSSGTFAIYFPEDAHAPIPSEKELIKVIIKVQS
jgi:biofilm protein TabA